MQTQMALGASVAPAAAQAAEALGLRLAPVVDRARLLARLGARS
jgi:hypothetical protein